MSETKYGDEATAEIVWRIIKPRIEQLIRDAAPKTIPMQPWALPPMGTKPICSKCGMELSGVMGYVCPAQDCPTFAKVTC